MPTGPSEDSFLFHTQNWGSSDRISSHLRRAAAASQHCTFRDRETEVDRVSVTLRGGC